MRVTALFGASLPASVKYQPNTIFMLQEQLHFIIISMEDMFEDIGINFSSNFHSYDCGR